MFSTRWLRPLPDPGWISGSLPLGQQICKPQVSSISLGEKKEEERKENYFTKCYRSSQSIMATGAGCSPGSQGQRLPQLSPWVGLRGPTWGADPAWGGLLSLHRTRRPGQRQPKGVWLSWVGQEVTLHPPPAPGHGRSSWTAASLCSGSRNRHRGRGQSRDLRLSRSVMSDFATP